MSAKVKIGQDGNIAFSASDSLPTSIKKFRQSPEIEGFYRFIYENDLQKEAFDILGQIMSRRKQAKSEARAKGRAKKS